MSRSQGDTSGDRVTRDDIEAKLRELRGSVDDRAEAAKLPAAAAGIGVALFVVLIAYWLGKRRGKKRQMVLEIRRI
jgi:hypothetical protein